MTRPCTILGVLVGCLVAAPGLQAETCPATPATWSELTYGAPLPGDPQSMIAAAGADWSLTAFKIQSAVPATDPAWQWETQYEDGTLDLMGLCGITDTVTGLTLTNLNNNDPATGLPVLFEISGGGTLTYGSTFSLWGQFDAAVSPFSVDMTPEGNILAQGELTDGTLTVNPIELTIDIKPGSDPNALNLGSNGVLPVAVLGSETFDVMTLADAMWTLAGAAPRERGQSGKSVVFEDVNGDMYMDLAMQFKVPELLVTDDTLILEGLLPNGETAVGSDTIKIVPVGPSMTVTPTPEPATLALLGLGLGGLLLRRRR